MGVEVILPRVDMDMATGRVSRWFVPDGGPVEKGQPLFEIETDKAAMEIEAPGTGLLHLVSTSEDAIPVGSTLAWILQPDEAPAAAPEAVASLEAPTADGPVGATPLARRLARQHAIPLAGVRGSGPRARIQARDVTALATGSTMRQPEPAPVAPPARSEPRPVTGAVHRVWLRDGTGTPLVLVHGFAADLDGWRPLVADLPRGRPVLAIDLPSHGRSAAATDPSLDGLADALASVISAEGLTAADLVGHSLGAAVAVRLAEMATCDIRSLLLISPGGLGPDINGAFLDGLGRARGEASLAPWLRLLVHDPAVLGDGFIRTAARKRDDALIVAQAELARALFPDGTQAFSVRDALLRLSLPVRVVFGTDDRIIPWQHALNLDAVAIQLFRGVGHMPHLEIRPAIARIVAELAA